MTTTVDVRKHGKMAYRLLLNNPIHYYKVDIMSFNYLHLRIVVRNFFLFLRSNNYLCLKKSSNFLLFPNYLVGKTQDKYRKG